ncbi:DotI/IcmL/TraM family protein (plasmid) [Nitratidesulfovibrio vulgaris]|nr:DotI/IcmL/TraM family protein [Nitratidesulfovibrio vulgaris]WCB48154.1 DotI/IcmL/TraM family protein [Nitratidesulfovibrio vulgaris]
MEQTTSEFTGLEQLQRGLHHYRSVNKKLLSALVCASAIACISTLGLFIIALQDPAVRYFAVTPDLRLQPLIPLTEPTITDAGIRSWAAEVATATLSLGFVRYRDQLSSVREHYTSESFGQLVQSLESSGNLQFIIDKRLNASAIPLSPPVIVNSGILQGTYTWQIEIPVRIAYESSHGNVSMQNNTVVMRVIRVPSTKHPRGIAITQFILN